MRASGPGDRRHGATGCARRRGGAPATSPTPTPCVRAARGADAAIHCAALLGGASQNLADFEAVNVGGTKNVLDAAEARRPGPGGGRSAPARSSTPPAGSTARTPRSRKEPSSDPYTITKMAAFEDAMARAAEGRDVVTAHPGRHLRPLTGGEQRARPDELQPGPAVRAPRDASSATSSSR